MINNYNIIHQIYKNSFHELRLHKKFLKKEIYTYQYKKYILYDEWFKIIKNYKGTNTWGELLVDSTEYYDTPL